MNKILILVSVVGLTAGIVYWLFKKEKSNNNTSKPADKKVDFKPEHKEEETPPKTNIAEEMYQAKSKSVQAVYERHSKAFEIMQDAYSNIMEDFVDDFSDEKVANENNEVKDVIIDSESVSVMKEIASISDELDDLLK